MELYEKIVLTLIDWILILIFGLGATISYLMVNDFVAMICCIIVFVLFYTLGLIEEQ